MRISFVLFSTHGVDEANAFLDSLSATITPDRLTDVYVVLSGAAVDQAGDGIDLHDPASDGTFVIDHDEAVRAVEAAIRDRSGSEIVVVASDDVRATPGWLEEIEQMYAARPDAAILAPYLVRRTETFGQAREEITLSGAIDSGEAFCLGLVTRATTVGRAEPYVQVPRARLDRPVPTGTVRVSSDRRENGTEAHLAGLAHRRRVFADLFDLGQGRGLEIGPSDASIADPEVHAVDFVDVYDQAGTRAKFADDPGTIIDLIPEIRFPLWNGTRFQTVGEAAAPGAPFEWILASHVIEHIPDVIGWLQELAELSSDGGALVLAIPDRRFTFDRHRPQTTSGMAIAAHLEGHRQPPARAIYDAQSSFTQVDAGALWQGGRPPGRASRVYAPTVALENARQGHAGEYHDVHVWTFTPQTFLEQIKEWRELGLCQWYVERLDETVPGAVEFHAVLRRIPRTCEDLFFPEPELESDLPDWLQAEWATGQELRDLVATLRAQGLLG